MTWIWHGEMTDMQSRPQSEPFYVEMGDRLEDMICDLGQESFQQAYAPMYDTLQSDSKLQGQWTPAETIPHKSFLGGCSGGGDLLTSPYFSSAMT